ncbi:LysR family transcriptional regulator [Sphingomonas sp. BK580]|uniref:LysR family transcriptional regulator n=1 Tax=Sphingomonas sp. BK580 TaxID=2586972 RepID=UPI0016197283|nr:LysR family transcriptional regulator [Sphingomonas sp. BK580]MBB3695251.1 DNA-binding transcriptional LysR family regulator [Sphingomonas sp. BK580]
MIDGRIIRGVTIFATVAEARSYTRAAETLGLSRSGIGKAIARLEERTGLKLFDRSSRALKLSPEGRELLATVLPLIERLGDAAVPSDRSLIRGHLRVSCDAAFGTYLLMPVLQSFFVSHPHIKIDLLIRDRLENLIAENIDVAVRFGEPDAPDVRKRLLFSSRIVTCASASYVQLHGAPEGPHDIDGRHNCIRLLDDLTGRPHSWSFMEADGHAYTLLPNCGLTVNDAPALMAGAMSGFGLARLLDFMAEEALSSGQLVEVLPEWNHRRWPAYLYTPRRSCSSAGVKVFVDFVTHHFSGEETRLGHPSEWIEQ